MAKFLNTSGTTYVLEQLIDKAQKRVILISPYLKFNKRIKQQIEDRTNQGISFDIVYGKTALNSQERAWLDGIGKIRLHYSEDLHAKCYLNESSCIITSMNLYEFSQVNNDEMGVLLTAKDDPEAFTKAAKEALRLIRISTPQAATAATDSSSAPDSSASAAAKPQNPAHAPTTQTAPTSEPRFSKITTSALAKKHNIKTAKLIHALKSAGYLFEENGLNKLTDSGKQIGGEFRKGSSGYYFIWPQELNINQVLSS